MMMKVNYSYDTAVDDFQHFYNFLVGKQVSYVVITHTFILI